ncbi:endonuclease/exonuclease/phosphatase family protein [Bacillus spongiae]|uniref:Endonuclease/exonuclease/phosphatase family protein n=1 Tax=Bacillus spongiae TaxID=2683610 RepID=A0ABU8HHK6_9BACI
MTFNILADGSTWRYRRSGIIRKILEINPDIMGLQEAMPMQRNNLEEGLSADYELIEFSIPVNYGNVMFIKRNEFTVLDSGFVEAAECGNMRYITWLLLREESSGGEFYIYNNHYCVSPMVSKETHSIELVGLIEQHQDQAGMNERATIVVGDFNSTRNNRIMEYLIDQVPIGGASNPLNLVDTWEVIYPTTPKPATTERGVAIDWILTMSGMTIVDASIGDSDGYSDHYPVTADVTLS